MEGLGEGVGGQVSGPVARHDKQSPLLLPFPTGFTLTYGLFSSGIIIPDCLPTTCPYLPPTIPVAFPTVYLITSW